METEMQDLGKEGWVRVTVRLKVLKRDAFSIILIASCHAHCMGHSPHKNPSTQTHVYTPSSHNLDLQTLTCCEEDLFNLEIRRYFAYGALSAPSDFSPKSSQAAPRVNK